VIHKVHICVVCNRLIVDMVHFPCEEVESGGPYLFGRTCTSNAEEFTSNTVLTGSNASIVGSPSAYDNRVYRIGTL